MFVSASHTPAAVSAKVCTSEVLGNVSVFGACLLKLDGVQFRTFCPASCVGRSATAGLGTQFSFPDTNALAASGHCITGISCEA